MTSGSIARIVSLASAAIWLATLAPATWAVEQGALVSERVKKLTHAVKWQQVAALPIKFEKPTRYVCEAESNRPSERSSLPPGAFLPEASCIPAED